MKKHTEARLEDAIVDHLTTHGGWRFVDDNKGEAKDRYDKARALDPALVVGFIQATQEKLWKSLAAIHGEETPRVVVDHLVKELETKGMLKMLRQGFKCYGKLLRVAVFASNNRMNPDMLALYVQNVLSVTRQLYYGTEHSKSLDLVLFLDGCSPSVQDVLPNGRRPRAVHREVLRQGHRPQPAVHRRTQLSNVLLQRTMPRQTESHFSHGLHRHHRLRGPITKTS